jgi:signal transduction histidine kinase
MTVPQNTIIFADHFFLAIIIDNLLNNAIKYGEDNGKIIISWDETNKIFSITNDGSGITADQIPFLFNRFYRTDSSRSSHIPGSGLGLSIVKKLADLQHLTISVQSTPGSTTFFLQLPA